MFSLSTAWSTSGDPTPPCFSCFLTETFGTRLPKSLQSIATFKQWEKLVCSRQPSAFFKHFFWEFPHDDGKFPFFKDMQKIKDHIYPLCVWMGVRLKSVTAMLVTSRCFESLFSWHFSVTLFLEKFPFTKVGICDPHFPLSEWWVEPFSVLEFSHFRPCWMGGCVLRRGGEPLYSTDGLFMAQCVCISALHVVGL